MHLTLHGALTLGVGLQRLVSFRCCGALHSCPADIMKHREVNDARALVIREESEQQCDGLWWQLA
jgi:hypothetical protein